MTTEEELKELRAMKARFEWWLNSSPKIEIEECSGRQPVVKIDGVLYVPADDLKNARWALRSAVNLIYPPLTGESAIEKFIMDENSKVDLEPIVRTEL